jgi:catechol 2,3-dioxygenase-like lactoylglutathione lyase family enzyme
MELKLELIIIPVSDVDAAKDFYVNRLGFRVEMDQQLGPDFRVARLIPQGSRCGIAIGPGLSDAAPGSAKGTHLMVHNADDVATELTAQGVTFGGSYHFVDGTGVDGAHPSGEAFDTFLDFADPDGTTRIIQEVPAEN